MRHRQRHVHKTIVEHVRAELDALGWFAAPAPFGTDPVTLMDYEPQQAGETPVNNTVSISIDHQGEDEDEDLGGGLSSVRYTCFLDVYTDTAPIGIAIAQDVKDAISRTTIGLLDYTSDASGTPVADAEIEFEHVLVESIPTATSTLDKRSWRSVKATAVCYFGE